MGEIIAEALETVFMNPVAVPPYRWPTSTQTAHATGKVRSCAP